MQGSLGRKVLGATISIAILTACGGSGGEPNAARIARRTAALVRPEPSPYGASAGSRGREARLFARRAASSLASKALGANQEAPSH